MHLKQSQYFQGVTLFLFPFNSVKFSGFNAYKTRKNESHKGTRKLIRILTIICTAMSLFFYFREEKNRWHLIFDAKCENINNDASVPSGDFVFVFFPDFLINKSLVRGEISAHCGNPEPLFERLPLGVQLLRLVKCWRQDGSNISGGRRAARAKSCTGLPIEIMPAFSTGASSYSRGHPGTASVKLIRRYSPGFPSYKIFHTCHGKHTGICWFWLWLEKCKTYHGQSGMISLLKAWQVLHQSDG